MVGVKVKVRAKARVEARVKARVVLGGGLQPGSGFGLELVACSSMSMSCDCRVFSAKRVS